MMRWRYWTQLSLAVLLAVLLPAVRVWAQATPTPTTVEASRPEGSDSASRYAATVETLLARMTVADRVGQLFLITFEGSDVGFDSDIVELIHGYRVGGVVLSPENGNFNNEKGADTAAQAAKLTNRLQGVAYGVLIPAEQALQPLPASALPDNYQQLEPLTNVPPVNIPLLIGAEQAGDALPSTALRRGFTPLPSAMALGATWNPDLARLVGQTAGRELHAVGMNMLLGPVLDVMETPRSDAVGGLGIYTFGGDPNWVSRLGQAYISGVHAGGNGRVATIARHFPGAGDIDRLPDEEVATVQRTLEDLERVTLPPFVAITRGPSSVIDPGGDPGVTDAMMVSQAHYSGFQGPSQGRNTPIGLAPGLSALLEQEGMADWHNQGGILVSHALGSPAIRRYYSPLLQEFPSRRVAMDAFRAGNDLLYLARFSLDDQWETEKQNIEETIGFFQEQYVNDAEFAGQVDTAVRRILHLKLGLYDGDGTATMPAVLADVLVTEADLAVFGEADQAEALAAMGQVAREAVTILQPDPASEAMTRVPQAGEDILIFTDSRLQQECPTCIAEAAVGPDAIAETILALYGPQGTGQIQPEQLTSLTFADLNELLDSEEAPPETSGIVATPAFTIPMTVETPIAPSLVGGEETVLTEGTTPEPELDKNAKTNLAIENAEWLIFAMLDVESLRYPNSAAVKRFLRLRGEQLAEKEVIVLALNAPYFLDTTEISRLSGYYSVYSKTQPFLEGAVRALFRAFTPTGAPPVSVPGTRFDNLEARLQPDPARPPLLMIYADSGSLIAGGASGAEIGPSTLDAGTVVQLQVGPVYDLNGKPLRDGTVVRFELAYTEDAQPPRVEQALTRGGTAIRDVTLDRGGVVQVTAHVGEVVTAKPVVLNVQDGLPLAETPAIESPAVQAPVTGGVALASAAGGAATTKGEQASIPARTRINLGSLVVALATMAAMLGLLLAVQARVAPRRMLLHSMLWAINCGLAAYILYALGWLPGGVWVETSLRVWGAALVTFGGMLAPLLWLQLRQG